MLHEQDDLQVFKILQSSVSQPVGAMPHILHFYKNQRHTTLQQYQSGGLGLLFGTPDDSSQHTYVPWCSGWQTLL